jgi:hypothetical protein
MRKLGLLLSSALALQIIAAPVLAADKKKEKAEPKGPSHYVQCDGNPNNMSAGESAARLLGAVTLLGIFAPAPETADPKARKFGKEGVDACNQILLGEKSEGNSARRIELTLARALHQIEAKDYDAALADVAQARKESAAGGYPEDPYYRRSTWLGMDQIEAAAYIRKNEPEKAVEAAYRQMEGARHQYLVISQMSNYSPFVKRDNPINEKIDAFNNYMQRISPDSAASRAARHAELGRFAEAAKIREAQLDVHLAFKPDDKASIYYAIAALDHALAGDWQKAEQRAGEAKANMEARVAAGKPEESRSETAEVLDLYEVLKLHNAGNISAARRMFTGRSAWLVPPLGAVMEANRRLSVGAKDDEKIGLLAKTADELWDERKTSTLAQMLAKDSDNKTLYYQLKNYSKGSGWEAYSKRVWDTKKKSKILADPAEKNGVIVAGLYDLYGEFWAQHDAMLLHTALTAKAKGHSHFYFNPLFEKGYSYAQVRFGKAGEPGLPAELVLEPDPVIAELEALIPPPEVIKARKAAATKKKPN